MTDLEVLSFISLKMFYAVVCGFIVGLERRINFSPAGFKTQILVCVGAMLYTSIPIIAGAPMTNETARIIAQIVTGVGFLGAGTIIHNNSRNVSGLTTAAWIWFTAAIGILIGIDHGQVALFITFTLVGVITLARYAEKKLFSSNRPSNFDRDAEKKEKDSDIRKAG